MFVSSYCVLVVALNRNNTIWATLKCCNFIDVVAFNGLHAY